VNNLFTLLCASVRVDYPDDRTLLSAVQLVGLCVGANVRTIKKGKKSVKEESERKNKNNEDTEDKGEHAGQTVDKVKVCTNPEELSIALHALNLRVKEAGLFTLVKTRVKDLIILLIGQLSTMGL